MKSVVGLVLSFLIAGAISHRANVIIPANPGVEVGKPCSPKHPKDCGVATFLLESSTPAGDDYGPNVCEIEMLYSVPTYSFEYKSSSCKRGKCYISCASTGNCDSARNYTRTKFTCCEGFTTAQAASSNEYYSTRNDPHDKPDQTVLKQEGCPREILPTVLDCLNQLNLTSLTAAFMAVKFAVLTSNDTEITLFAPSVELDLGNIGGHDLSAVLGTHIVNKTILASSLENGKKLETLSDGLFLHISEVHMKGVDETLFVNGMELTGRDACVADNGIVHVIDGFILAEERTIAEVVADTEELSILNSLITAAGVDELRLNGSRLLTLFAPTNEAFEGLESMGFIDCLLMEENEKTLQKFMKNHILHSAEYSSSLVLQKHKKSESDRKKNHKSHDASNIRYRRRSNKNGNFLEVQFVNSTIFLGSDGVEITQADIAASNGVIHFISGPLSVSKLNLDELCPAAITPTTSTTDLSEAPTTTTTMLTESPTEPEVEGGHHRDN